MGSKSSGNRSGKPRAKGAGRPTIKFTVRHGQKLLMERQTMGMDINERREVWTVLNISRDEIEFQCDNDIIVVRVPDENE